MSRPQAYKGTIPADRWHEPYMSMDEMKDEIAKGVCFHGYYLDGNLIGVMGIQDVKDVTLIRHAYVLTKFRSKGIGRQMLDRPKTAHDTANPHRNTESGHLGSAILSKERISTGGRRGQELLVEKLLDRARTSNPRIGRSNKHRAMKWKCISGALPLHEEKCSASVIPAGDRTHACGPKMA